MLNTLWGKLASAIANSGLVDKLMDLAKAYFPPDLSPEQKIQFELENESVSLT